jgi:hypothetical protein
MSVFGFSTEPSSGGDFLPICKFDSRAGRLFRVDRNDVGGQFVSESVDITTSAKFVADFENIETGWINFPPAGAPDFRMVPMGHALPERPSPAHKNGVRFMLKLDKASGGDKPIREISSSARAFLAGLENVYLAYQAQKGENPGKLPVLVLEKTTPIKSGSGDKTSTNYQPTFKIVAWAPRGDLVFQPKGGAAPSPSAASATPPSTGSTRVEPPAAKQPEMAETDDFG